MWGPLPAPFPRALAGATVLAAFVAMAIAPGPDAAWALLTIGPLALLWRQRRGEERLQRSLEAALGTQRFEPVSH